MAWNPIQYLKFAGPRLQPGLDLIARLPDARAERVVDLGCGTGQLTALLGERFPGAAVAGVDSSPEMLAKAAEAHPGIVWRQDDIATWTPGQPVDVIYSNAALQWLPSHETLLPRLVGQLTPGGVLAVQMPRNFRAPSHAAMRATAADGPWKGRIALREEPVLPPEAYYDLLAPRVASLEIWETEYLHVLEGPSPVLEWTRGTALLPVFEALEGQELEDFIADYSRRLDRAYPVRPDGRTLFPFRRIFLLARAA
ncbi:MAG TPA: methyltransferase domain-containing protein [Alphaproteobacteria bacterium]|nr:methyltransferase domain-containing protein [Alphaproteobacteria bacterium]